MIKVKKSEFELLRAHFKALRNKLHNSIEEMPIYNWWKIHETKDISYLFKKEIDAKKYKKNITLEDNKFLSIRWQRLYNQYIQRYGFSDEFLEVIEKERQIALMKIEMFESEQFTMETAIEIEEYNLNKKKESKIKVKSDFYQNKALIEKRVGFRIDVKNCSVVEFISYTNLQ